MTEPYEQTEPATSEGSVFRLVVAVMAALLLIVGVVAVAAGKDDDGPSADPIALLTGAPDAVRDAGSARVTMSMTMQSTGFSFDMHATGAAEFATGRGTLTMSFLGIDMEMISDGTTLYIHVPDGGRLPGATAPWVAVPADAMQSGGAFGSSIQSTTGLLDALRGIGGDVDEIGTEEVNGVQATHYHVVVSLEDAIAAAPEQQRAEARAALEQLGQLGAAEMPVDVWISGDGLPVRQVMTFDAPEGGVLGDMTMKVTVDLSDFGAPVEIHVPPTDQVQQIDPAQIGTLFGGLGSAS